MSGDTKELLINSPKMLRDREEQRKKSFFGSFTEQKLFELIKEKLFYDLESTNKINKFSYYDAFTLKWLSQLELKCRRIHCDLMFIQEDKWEKLKNSNYKRAFYVNSTPEGFFIWDIKKIDKSDILWDWVEMNKETETENGEVIEYPEKELKFVGHLPIIMATNLTEKLINIYENQSSVS
jgi:hypothetical protein